MAARSPEDICSLFQQYMAEGKLEELLSIYDTDAVFLSQSGELKKGRQGMREVLAPLVAAHTSFNYKVIQIIQSGDIALMHTLWEATPATTDIHARDRGRTPSV